MAFCIPQRYVFAIMGHFGLFIVYALRVNISVAMVAMVNSTYSHKSSHPECNKLKNITGQPNKGEFNWDQNQQGLILASFFYGYLFTQFPGGVIANKFGGKFVFGFGVFIASLLTLLTPIAAKTNFYFLIVVRVLMGIGEIPPDAIVGVVNRDITSKQNTQYSSSSPKPE